MPFVLAASFENAEILSLFIILLRLSLCGVSSVCGASVVGEILAGVIIGQWLLGWFSRRY